MKMTEKEEALLAQGTSIIEEVAERFPHHREALEGVEVRLSRRLTRSSGTADPWKKILQLSVPIFSLEENLPEVRPTVLHEIAHIIAGGGARSHGPRWRAICLEIGGDGERCHSLRSTRQHRLHRVHCESCGEEIEVGSRVHNRIVAGSRDYLHIGCGGVVASVDQVAPARNVLAGLIHRLRQGSLFG
ncbi:MAG TPA: hypothetical protein EYN79_08785 [Planctomycetes bacterium]|nr:hypothetical protein [Planctomycetota bacterium]HIN81299.1 hypothetical protein [Planctomycetota bacterium]